MDFVSRRGSWRTAFEAGKLLLSVNPDEDPLAIFLAIDFYAIKAGQFEWVKIMWDNFGIERGLEFLPNWCYSIAIVEQKLSGSKGYDLNSKASQLLQRALLIFPWTVPFLLEKCGATDPILSSHSYFIPALNLREIISNLERTRGKIIIIIQRILNVQKVLEWLRLNLLVCLNRISASKDVEIEEGAKIRELDFTEGLSRDMLRHIFLSDFSSLSSALPVGEAIMSFDPIPPVSSQSSNRILPQVESISSMFQSLLPWIHENGANINENMDAEELDQRIRATIQQVEEIMPGSFPSNNEESGIERSLYQQISDLFGIFRGSEENESADPNNIEEQADD
ncbi:Transcription factor 25 [Nowakowskiella sp. JEL0078]|nr:Transcription factor 25 [Nowakowskiella sp. JEL0078]